jgi:hypothetical protein
LLPSSTVVSKVNPSHYKDRKYETIDVLEDCIAKWPPGTALRIGQALAYLIRHQEKDGLVDLHKAMWYIQREIASHELEESNKR